MQHLRTRVKTNGEMVVEVTTAEHAGEFVIDGTMVTGSFPRGTVSQDGFITSAQVQTLLSASNQLATGSITVNGTQSTGLIFQSGTIDLTFISGTTYIDKLPPYIVGKDASRLLKRLFDGNGKSLSTWGDSRSVNMIGEWVPNVTCLDWGGFAVGRWVTNAGNDMPNYYAGSVHSLAAGSELTSSIAVMLDEISVGVTSSIRTELNHFWNRIAYSANDDTTNALFANVQGRDINVCQEFLLEPTGVTGSSIALQAWVNGDYINSPQWVRSTFFPTYAASATRTVKQITIVSGANWGTYGTGSGGAIAVEVVCHGTIPTENTKTITILDSAWIERADGTGITIFDYAMGGDKLGDDIGPFAGLYDDLGPNQYPPIKCQNSCYLRATREPWIYIDIGTNGTQPYTKDFHMTRLRKWIKKVRDFYKSPDAPVILGTNYQTGADAGATTTFTREGTLEVARADSNIMLIDTWKALADAGGYDFAVANGLMNGVDTVHFTSFGRTYRGRMVNRILQGITLDYTALLTGP